MSIQNFPNSKEQKLRYIVQDHPWSRKFFKYIASRRANHKFTSIERVAKMTEVDYTQAVRLAEALNEIDVGKFVVGRRGAKSRIIWNFHRNSIGEVVFDPLAKLQDAGDQINREEDEQELDASNQPEEPAVRDIEHAFQLRPDRAVVLALPADLTAHEATRLANFVRSLPFGE